MKNKSIYRTSVYGLRQALLFFLVTALAIAAPVAVAFAQEILYVAEAGAWTTD